MQELRRSAHVPQVEGRARGREEAQGEPWRKVAKKTTSAKGSRASASTAKAAPEPAANVREWSDRIAAFQTQGTAPSPYTIRATFSEGEYVDHKKFGKGVVLEVVSADKINVLFEDGARTLIMGRV